MNKNQTMAFSKNATLESLMCPRPAIDAFPVFPRLPTLDPQESSMEGWPENDSLTCD